MILTVFVTGMVVLWVSVFGYPLALAVIRRRRAAGPPAVSLPDVAVVVPTLNEERLIAAKLEDLARTDYPPERLTLVVVDGGSTDRTCAIVESAIARGQPVRLMRVPPPTAQPDQVCRALATLAHDLVVLTDADTRLEPGCIRALVTELLRDPQLAVVGPLVRPDTALLEERLYWWALTRLWWLEGEALSAAMVTCACVALRRSALAAGADTAFALDVNLAAGASCRGMAARLCRSAQATELRVPRSAREFVAFRRRRGTAYLQEILRAGGGSAPFGWRVARAVRVWQMAVVPWIAAALALCAGWLLGTPEWEWPLLAGAAFLAPAGLLLVTTDALREDPSRWRIALGAARAAFLTLFALALLRRPGAREQAA